MLKFDYKYQYIKGYRVSGTRTYYLQRSCYLSKVNINYKDRLEWADNPGWKYWRGATIRFR
jgi:hypothetical protein